MLSYHTLFESYRVTQNKGTVDNLEMYFKVFFFKWNAPYIITKIKRRVIQIYHMNTLLISNLSTIMISNFVFSVTTVKTSGAMNFIL